jgi:hypothetical protein
VNNAAENMAVQISFQHTPLSVLLGLCLEVEFLDHMMIFSLTLDCHIVSVAVVPLFNPTNGAISLQYLLLLYLFIYFNSSHPRG